MAAIATQTIEAPAGKLEEVGSSCLGSSFPHDSRPSCTSRQPNHRLALHVGHVHRTAQCSGSMDFSSGSHARPWSTVSHGRGAGGDEVCMFNPHTLPCAAAHVAFLQVLYRLQEKRIALEKVVLQYGDAPTGIKEVFELCRGFERAYTNFINVSSSSSSSRGVHAAVLPLAQRTRRITGQPCVPGGATANSTEAAILRTPRTARRGLTRPPGAWPRLSRALQESPVASKIKDAFLGEKGLAGKVKKLPFDKVFELKNVKAVRGQLPARPTLTRNEAPARRNWGAQTKAVLIAAPRHHPHARKTAPTA